MHGVGNTAITKERVGNVFFVCAIYFLFFGNTAAAGVTGGRGDIGNTVVDKEGVIFEGGGNTASRKVNRVRELEMYK